MLHLCDKPCQLQVRHDEYMSRPVERPKRAATGSAGPYGECLSIPSLRALLSRIVSAVVKLTPFVPIGPQRTLQTGCLGCASGKDAGPQNIFGNKYGQNLAAVQVTRERRIEAAKAREEERKRLRDEEQKRRELEERERAETDEGGEGESETDDEETDSDEDYGPTPAAGIWAGSKKLEEESEHIDEDRGDSSEDDRPQKKKRSS